MSYLGEDLLFQEDRECSPALLKLRSKIERRGQRY